MINFDVAGYTIRFTWNQLRPAVLGGALLLTLLIGPMQEVVPPEILVVAMAAPLGIIGAWVFLSVPMTYLVLALPALATLLGGYILPSNATVTLIFALGLVGVWVLRLLLGDRRLRFVGARQYVPLVGFMVVLVISFGWSNLFRDPLVVIWADFPLVQTVSCMMMLMLPIASMMVVNFLRGTKWLKILWFIMIAGGALYGLGVLLNLPYIQYMGVEGVWPMWVISLAYAQALYNERLKLWQKVGLLALCAVMVYRFFFLGYAIAWVSGWAPMLTAIVTITFIRSRKLTILMIAVALVFIYVKSDYLYEAIFVEAEEDGSYERFELWQTNINLVTKHWLFGTGPAGYAVYYMTYHPGNARSTHNNYFDVLSQVGITGFLFYVWFFFSIGWLALRLMVRLRGRRDFEEGLTNAVLGAWPAVMLAMMLGDWIMPFAYNGTIAGYSHALYTWMMFGALIAIDHLTGPTATETAPPGLMAKTDFNVSQTKLTPNSNIRQVG